MGNLFGIGLSGLSAAQAALATSSNNISNVNTPGYNRQSIQLGAIATAGGQGGGVLATGVERHYQQYLTGQLNAAQSSSTALETHLGQLSQINNLLGDSEAGLAPLMQQFFAGMQTLAANPSDAAARQSLLGDANSVTAQFRAFSEYFSDMQGSVELQMQGAVTQVNNYAEQISSLNEQITLTQSKTGRPPNTLLDQRDRLVSELGELVDVELTVQDGSKYTIAVAGQSLVDATGANSLVLVNSRQDPTRQVIAYETPTGGIRHVDEDQVSGGTLGGLVQFRKDSLEPAQLRLDQLAHGLAARVNEVHTSGFDLSGDAGGVFFGAARPVSFTHATNTGDATLEATFTPEPSDPSPPSELSKVAASNYRVEYSGGEYRITRLSDGNQTTADDTSFSVGGVDVTVDGTPEEGDSFLIKPLANAATDLDVAISDPAAIAASGGGGSGDNRNALALADLQSEPTINGNTSFNSAYAQMVSDIGNKTRTLQVNSSAQATLTGELQSAQQSVSGVNLDEERVNLLYYQQMYQANARVIQTAATLFDTLLSIRP